MNKSQNSKTDLITLTHPFILLSIFILLINDHVLKIYFPSVLTGKLSDFAGLFFFPILLSVILHFVVKPFQILSRNIALASFFFTVIFFSLIKTDPFFNDFIEELFSIQIIRDPSDLMALIMLPLAWKLRENIVSESKTRISKLSYVALGVASLATIATSPIPSPPSINNLIVFENIVYADFSINANEDVNHEGIVYSRDGGRSWQKLDFELPYQVVQEREIYSEQPYTICLWQDPNTCYQTNDTQILETKTGGTAWHVSWKIPKERQIYFQRTKNWSSLSVRDIVYLELNGNNIIVASAGSHGVLIKTNNSEWESIEVNGMGPILLNATSFEEAKDKTKTEFYVILLSTLLLIYTNIFININNRKSKGYYLFLIVFWASIVMPLIFIFILLIESSLDVPRRILALGGKIYLAIFFISLFLNIVFTPYQLFSNTNKKAKINLILLVIIMSISYSLFILWAYGTIFDYAIPKVIVIGLYILTLLRILNFPLEKFIHNRKNISSKTTD